MERPPCWPKGHARPNPCAAAHHARLVSNLTPLYGPWTGWRMAGQRLVSPHGEWIAPHLLDRWLHRHSREFAESGKSVTSGRNGTKAARTRQNRTPAQRRQLHTVKRHRALRAPTAATKPIQRHRQNRPSQ